MGTAAARDDLLATTEAKRAVVLSLVASVASSYINMTNLDRQLEISRLTAKSRGDSLHVFELRFHGGVVSEFEGAEPIAIPGRAGVDTASGRPDRPGRERTVGAHGTQPRFG